MSSVTVTITLEVATDAREHMDALNNLAAVMAVQAEDGLWSLGSPDAENEDGPSMFVAEFGSCSTAVTIA